MLNIVINNGSTSKNYALYKGEENICSAYYEKTPEGFALTEIAGIKESSTEIDKKTFEKGFDHFIDGLLTSNRIKSETEIVSVTFRVVAPNKYFQEHRIIDREFLLKLEQVAKIAPLHVIPLKEEILNARKRLPDVKEIGISDSAFHKTMKEEAFLYAIPKTLAEEYELYRYGYHGISLSATVNYLKSKDILKEKIVVCHLGGGSSITALKNGESIDTSMGFSPLEGLPMASRSGNMDSNVLLTIMDKKNFNKKETQDFLYHKCGVLGLSNISSDTRVLLREMSNGNKDAESAINLYVYTAQKYIGAYATVLGGLDALVFTGKIDT